mgnify:CR=1 FL=1
MTPEPPAASAHDHVKGHDINGECHACADEQEELETLRAERDHLSASYDRQTENMRHWIARYEEVRAALEVAYDGWVDTDTHPRHGSGECAHCDHISDTYIALTT